MGKSALTGFWRWIKKITLAMVVEPDGKILEWKDSSGKIRFVPEKVLETLAGPWSAIFRDILMRLQNFLGRVEYVMINYEKVNLLGFIKGDHIVVLAVEKDMPAGSIEKIRKELV